MYLTKWLLSVILYQVNNAKVKQVKKAVKPRISCSSLLSTVMTLAVTSRGGLKPTFSANCRRSFQQSAPARHSPAKIKQTMIFWWVLQFMAVVY